MKTAIIIKTEPKIKANAQKIAADMGLSLSGIINVYLRQFIKTKTLYLNLGDISSKQEKVWLKQSAEAQKNAKRYKNVDKLISKLN